jgi:hypothetical protein
MSGKDRRLFLFPITIIGWLRAPLVILELVAWVSSETKEKVPFDYILFFSMFVPPLVIWFGFRAWQISRSVHRYNERGARVF